MVMIMDMDLDMHTHMDGKGREAKDLIQWTSGRMTDWIVSRLVGWLFVQPDTRIHTGL